MILALVAGMVLAVGDASTNAVGTANAEATANASGTATPVAPATPTATPTPNATATPTPAAAATPIATSVDLGAFITGYYRTPRPERLVEALLAADRLGLLGEGTVVPLSAFAGAVLRAHPELVASGARALAGASTAGQLAWWRSVWASGTPAALAALSTAVGSTAPVRDAIRTMQTSPPPDPLLAAITAPADLDVLWMSFFATGDGRPVVRIAALLGWDTDPDAQRRLVAQAAHWSLRTNGETHPRVREVLAAAAAAGGEGADPERLRALLAEEGTPEPPPR